MYHWKQNAGKQGEDVGDSHHLMQHFVPCQMNNETGQTFRDTRYALDEYHGQKEGYNPSCHQEDDKTAHAPAEIIRELPVV